MLSSENSTLTDEREPLTVRGFLVEGQLFHGVDSGDAISQYVRQQGGSLGRHGCKVVEDLTAKSFSAVWDSDLHCYVDVATSEYRSLDQDTRAQLMDLTRSLDALCGQRSKLADKVRLGVNVTEGCGFRWQSEAELLGLKKELTETRQYVLDSGAGPADRRIVELDERLEPIDTKLARINSSRGELAGVESQIASIGDRLKKLKLANCDKGTGVNG